MPLGTGPLLVSRADGGHVGYHHGVMVLETMMMNGLPGALLAMWMLPRKVPALAVERLTLKVAIRN